jgi:DNA invertase Pin-like site-specific DNA recombinase
MSKKVALYCRVSTGNQSTGLEAQVRALREYCSRNAISDYVIFEDENQKGSIFKGPIVMNSGP